MNIVELLFFGFHSTESLLAHIFVRNMTQFSLLGLGLYQKSSLLKYFALLNSINGEKISVVSWIKMYSIKNILVYDKREKGSLKGNRSMNYLLKNVILVHKFEGKSQFIFCWGRILIDVILMRYISEAVLLNFIIDIKYSSKLFWHCTKFLISLFRANILNFNHASSIRY